MMSQSCVTSYYNTRKRRLENKLVKAKDEGLHTVLSTPSLKTCSEFFTALCDQKIISPSDDVFKPEEKVNASQTDPKKNVVRASTAIKAKAVKTSAQFTKPKAPKTNNRLKGKKKTERSDIRSIFQAQLDKSSKEASTSEETNPLNVTYELECSTLPANEVPILKTPKRTHSEPEEPPVDSKKKKPNSTNNENTEVSPVVERSSTITQRDVHPVARKKLDMTAQSKDRQKDKSQKIEKAKTASDGKLKFLSCGNIEDLKERLQKFDKTYQKLKEFQSNKFKITSVIPAAVSTEKQAPVEQEKPVTIPCYEKFAHLDFVGPPSLILPFRYKLLSEMFRSSDTIVSMLHNRKERCTFEKLKSGVQDMTKKSFTKHNLGQIKTIFPTAYNYSIEKNQPAILNRNPGLPQYQLVLSPNLNYGESSKNEVSPKTSESAAFTTMTPSCLVERNNIFSARLLQRVKQHHHVFLSKLNPPIQVPMDKLTKWHAKFRLDEVPDIEASSLPEPPNAHKVDTAKDVLNKIRGIANKKVESALEKVAQMTSASSTQVKEEEKVKPKVTAGVLKGISMDLLQRIRARENVKIAEEMTVSIEEQKRTEMLERIPELVNILRTYFITERKAAMSLEDAALRLSDSYHTSLAPSDVEKHIHLMSQLFPSWITLIPIRKGVFIKIDKNKDINVMLNNMPKK